MRMFAVVAVGLLVACSSSSEDQAGPGCGDISGNYTAQATRVSGTCDVALDGDGKTTFSISRGDGDAWNILLPGLTGGCPATLDAACKLISNCELFGQDGSVIGTASVEYTFSGRTFTGTSVSAARPPAVATACSANYTQTGSKL
jgi:hypothetical protein